MSDNEERNDDQQQRVVMRYPLNVGYSHTGDCQVLMTKGHHPIDDFLKDCERECGEPLSDIWSKPRHEWWRFVPAPLSSDCGYNGFYCDAEPHSRGAFPVTVMDDA